LFEENCPKYFSENERSDYIEFLESTPTSYFVGIQENKVLSAFGVTTTQSRERARLSWIMVSSNAKGYGLGMTMMNQAKLICVQNKVSIVDIAASHLSAPFFAKFGAEKLNEIPHGWGAGMHRIDMELIL